MAFFSFLFKPHLQCILLVLVIIQPSLNYTIIGTLTDLTSTTLASEASSWTLSSYYPANTALNKVSTCAGIYILGGFQILGGSGASSYGQYFQRTYSGLPYHNQINLQMTIYTLDQWDALSGINDYFTISFDGIELYAYATMRYGSAISLMCANPSAYDYPPFLMKVTIPHIDSALTLRLTSYLDGTSNDNSLGFRDIKMDFVYQDEPERTVCAVSSQTLPDKPCPCSATNQYMSPLRSGTCINCDPTCATCTGGSSSECLTCYAGSNTYFKDFKCLTCDSTCATCNGGGINQCTTCTTTNNFMVKGYCFPTCDPPLYHYEISDIVYCDTPCQGSYVYWDSTCMSVCPYPMLPTVVSSFSLCTFPCSANQYLYWNRTCSMTCDPPYEVVNYKTRNFCVWPCAKNEYAYWDNTCEATCAPPLVKYSIGSPIEKDFCAYPCQLYEYVYWNGTCSDTCEAPLVASTKHGRQFCTYPCLITDYLYFNGSCLNSCPAPFTLRVEDARAYCDYGCTDALDYLYWNGTCGSCDSPLVKRIEAGKQYCDFGCADDTEFRYWDNTCQSTCSPPLVMSPQGTHILRYICYYPCGVSQYLYWNGTCSDKCPDPLTKRTTNSRKFCDFPCDVDKYSYWDGTCASTCPEPYLNRFEGNPTRKYCDYPCLDSEYLFWNNSCGACPSPLTTRTTAGKKYCDYPCDDDEYLYWDGSCNSTCAFPLTSDIQGDDVTRNFCYFPCLETQYLYWNGSCSYYCNYPYVVGGEYDRMTCNYPCLVAEYLYYNGTCMNSCTLPLSYRNESSRNYCDYPCKNYEFLAWDGTCLDFCVFPYVTLYYDGLQFCRLPCYPTYYYFPDSMLCNETCTYPYTSDSDLPYMRCYPPVNPDYAASWLEAPTNPGTVSFITLTRMMEYLRYLNEDLPPRVERLALSKGRPILSTSAGIQPGGQITMFFERFVELDGIYSKHGLQESFLANYWNEMTTFLIFLLSGIALLMLEKTLVAIDFQLLALVTQRLRIIMMWNFPLMLLAVSIDDIILFAYLEFKTLGARSYSSVSSTVSFLVCLIFLAASVVGIPLLTYYIIRKNRFYEAREASNSDAAPKKSEGRIRDGYRNLETKKIRFESFQVLYRGFKQNNIWNQMFFVLYMARIGLPMVVAICCENHPLVCSLVQLLINMAMINFVFWMKPFEKQVNYYQIMLYEIGVLMLNVCVGLLSVMEATSSAYPLASKALGTTILAGNGLLNVLLLVFLVIKCLIEIVAISNEMDKQGIKGIRSYIPFIQVLFLYLQEGNMGFEEIINYQPYSQVPRGRAIFPTQAATETSFLNYETSHRELINLSARGLDRSYTGDQSTIVETGVRQNTQGAEDDSIIALPPLETSPSPKNIEKAEPLPEPESELERAVTPESEPEFEIVTRPRQKSLSIESPSKERKTWEEETGPELKRTEIKRRPIKKQWGGMNFTPMNF